MQALTTLCRRPPISVPTTLNPRPLLHDTVHPNLYSCNILYPDLCSHNAVPPTSALSNPACTGAGGHYHTVWTLTVLGLPWVHSPLSPGTGITHVPGVHTAPQ